MSDSPYSFKNLALEPYRLFFFVGSIMAISAGLHWLVFFAPTFDTGGFSRPPVQFHGYQMLYTTLSYFIVGFLLTAFPRWIKSKPFSFKQSFFLLALLVATEGCLFFAVKRDGFYLGALFFQGGFFISVLALLIIRLKSIRFYLAKDIQPFLIILAFFWGGLGAILGGLGFLLPYEFRYQALSVSWGIYGFLLMLILGVSLRVLPFFTQKVLGEKERRTMKHAGLCCGIILSFRNILSFFSYYCPDSLLGHEIGPLILDSILGLSVFFTLIQCAGLKNFIKIIKTPLLFVIYLGLFWVGIFLCFSFLRLIGEIGAFQSDFLVFHEKTFLHILTLGGIGTLLMGIMTRVTRGHGGQKLLLGGAGAGAIILMHTAMVVRLLPLISSDWARWKHGAGALWALAFLVWAIGHFRWLFYRPQKA